MTWQRRNRITLGALVVLLVVAALAGELGPPAAALTSVAHPYNAFHLVAGVCGIAVLVFGGPRAVAAFNIGFGLVDLYQGVAGVASLEPAQLFQLTPADHVIHFVLGAALVLVGAAGRGRGLRPVLTAGAATPPSSSRPRRDTGRFESRATSA